MADDVSAETMRRIRELTTTAASTDDVALLRTIGALRSDNRLSQAAAIALCPSDHSLLEFSVLTVTGGNVESHTGTSSGTSLLDQVLELETLLNMVNRAEPTGSGFPTKPVRAVPEAAAREAILNGVIHRDWNLSEPTDVRWIRLDDTLTVRSPGGFIQGISSDNVLSNRAARYPSLADLFRALGLVEKQGLGVDRMYQAMIVVGHRPPHIEQSAGPHVECSLHGGRPVYPVVDLVHRITPVERQHDSNIAILIYELLQSPFVTTASLAKALQASTDAAATTLRAAAQTTVDSTRLIVPLGSTARGTEAWQFGAGAWNRITRSRDDDMLFPLMPYASTDADDLAHTAQQWIGTHGSVSSGELRMLTGVARGTAKKSLDDMVAGGLLTLVGSGRSTRYVLA